jgi:hypothetical protein
LTTTTKAYTAAQFGQYSLQTAADQAQQGTLVRLQKLKEEFLALFRTISESKGFQVFLEITLKLGNAIGFLAENLTPLIPMLGALAALKIGQGVTSFFPGLSTGLFGGVNAQKGVIRRQSGGLVPGVGDGDTVPALLEGGEYVIRKQDSPRVDISTIELVELILS